MGDRKLNLIMWKKFFKITVFNHRDKRIVFGY